MKLIALVALLYGGQVVPAIGVEAMDHLSLFVASATPESTQVDRGVEAFAARKGTVRYVHDNSQHAAGVTFDQGLCISEVNGILVAFPREDCKPMLADRLLAGGDEIFRNILWVGARSPENGIIHEDIDRRRAAKVGQFDFAFHAEAVTVLEGFGNVLAFNGYPRTLLTSQYLVSFAGGGGGLDRGLGGVLTLANSGKSGPEGSTQKPNSPSADQKPNSSEDLYCSFCPNIPKTEKEHKDRRGLIMLGGVVIPFLVFFVALRGSRSRYDETGVKGVIASIVLFLAWVVYCDINAAVGRAETGADSGWSQGESKHQD